VGSTTINPGDETTVDFDLAMGMHAGMEGPHLFRVTVPAKTASGQAGTIQLYIKADFE
jgi:hypothetical protein